jgi:hypothetical protein
MYLLKFRIRQQKKLAELVLASKGGQVDAAITGLNDLIEALSNMDRTTT